ncbi:MAG: hypothetical protein EOO41_05430, partial [Methanobacteriota archaeon]
MSPRRTQHTTAPLPSVARHSGSPRLITTLLLALRPTPSARVRTHALRGFRACSMACPTSALPPSSAWPRLVAASLRAAAVAAAAGAAYGVRVRGVHASVTTLLFSRDATPLAAAQRVLRLTLEHAKKLALFAALYKAAVTALRALLPAASLASRSGHAWPGAAAGALAAAVVWRGNTAVTMQLVLYLLPRVLLAVCRRLAAQGVAPFSSVTFDQVFPVLSVAVWAAVMFLWEENPSLLQPSLASSMNAIYAADQGAPDVRRHRASLLTGPSSTHVVEWWRAAMPSRATIAVILLSI